MTLKKHLHISLIELVKALWNQISKKRQKHFYLLLILMFFAAIAETISLGLIVPFLGILAEPSMVFNHTYAKPFISFFNLQNSEQIILPVTFIFIVSIVFSVFLRMILLYYSAKLPYLASNELGNKIFSNALYKPYSYHLRHNSSETINAITVKINFINTGVIMPLAILISSSAIIISVLSMLLFFDPFFTIAILLFFVFLYGSLLFFAKLKLKKNSEIVANNSTAIVKLLQEAFGGIRDVLIDQNQKIYSNKFNYLDFPMRMSQSVNRFIVAAPRFIIEGVGMILISLIAYWGLYHYEGQSSIILIKLTVLAVVAQRLLPLLQQVYGSMSELIGYKHSLQDIVTLLQKQDNSVQIDHTKIIFSSTIMLSNIGFKYENNSYKTLKSVNFTINKGDIVGFVGETGCGKSTLLDILMGLLKPSEGKIVIDGIEITNSNVSQWYKHISHVPQDIYLTDGSIKENIAFGVANPEDIDMSKVIKSSKLAKIDNVIESLEEKYDTVIGERGVRLSGGQKQRIGIARALYKESSVIVLDEATSALDSNTENEVMKSIMNLNRQPTILIIAHRVNTLDECNKIVSFSKNGIVEINSIKT